MTSNINNSHPHPTFDLSTVDTTLEEPDMNRVKDGRFQRNRDVMNTMNPYVTNTAFPLTKNLNERDIAATRIQAVYRGYLGRKQYLLLLCQQFEQEEEERRQKILEQVEEGELLVENHRLEVELEDNQTTRRNRSRQINSQATTIQRAWRLYQEKKVRGPRDAQPMSESSSSDSLAKIGHADDISSPHRPSVAVESSQSQASPVEEEGGHLDEDCSVASSVSHKGSTAAAKTQTHLMIDTDPESMVSDYSEMAETIKEHLANVQIIRKEDLDSGNHMPTDAYVIEQRVTQLPGETYAEFAKRLRKLNFLSLAQEFAELKKVDANVLPFDAHKAHLPLSPDSDTASSIMTDSGGSYNMADSGGSYNMADSVIAVTTAGARSVDDGTVPKQAWSEENTASKPHDSEHTKSQNAEPVATDLATGVESSHNAPVHQHHTKTAPHASTDSNAINKTDSNLKPADLSVDQPDSESRPLIEGEGDAGLKPAPEKSRSKSPLPRYLIGSEGGQRSRSASASPRRGQSATTSGKETDEPLDDFDVYNIESTLPQMDWAKIEEELQRAAQEERQKKSQQKNDRQEILRKLAMGPENEPVGFDPDKALKKSNMQSRFQHGHVLQVCFMNEDLGPTQTNPATQTDTAPVTENSEPAPQRREVVEGGGTEGRKEVEKEAGKEGEEGDLKTRQQRLQHEATLALAQARPMAHMQLMVEKQKKKKSPLADIVGIPGLGDNKILEITHAMLLAMNLAQLQVVVNDLHSQIEALNMELMSQLMERDDLHMEQDSMLVDIEDLHRRAEDLSHQVASTPATPSRRRDKRK